MIISQFDNEYLEWGKILTKTCSKKYWQHTLFLSTVNLNDDQIALLESLHHDIIVHNEFVDKKSIPKVKSRKRLGGSLDYHMPEYMACRKASVLQDAFKKFPNEKLFIMTDADIFINKSFSFETEINDYDALLLIGDDPSASAKGQGFHTKIRSGIIVLKNNSICRALVDSWINSMLYHNNIESWKKWHWFWDQVTLKLTVEDLIVRGIKVKGLPHEKFIDSSFNEESYVWSAHTGGVEGKKRALIHWRNKIFKKLDLNVYMTYSDATANALSFPQTRTWTSTDYSPDLQGIPIVPETIRRFNEYWGENIPVTLFGYSEPDFEIPPNFKFVSMGVDRGVTYWASDLYEAFSNIEDENFIWFMDDMWFNKPVNAEVINDYCSKYINEDFMRMNLCSIKGNLHGAGGKVTSESLGMAYELVNDNNKYPIYKMNQNSNWRIGAGCMIYNRKKLLNYLFTTDRERGEDQGSDRPAGSPWCFEVLGSYQSKYDGFDVYDFKGDAPVSYIHHVCRRGDY